MSHLANRPVVPPQARFDESEHINAGSLAGLSVAELKQRLSSVQSERQRRMPARLPSTKLALLEHDLISELRRRDVVPSPD